jgi:hypothetical protein
MQACRDQEVIPIGHTSAEGVVAINSVVAKADMSKPLFKASDGGQIDNLGNWGDFAYVNSNRVWDVSGTFTEGSPRSLSDRFTHVRMVKFLQHLGQWA